tara:strand:+ start:986 stop:2734 length:1749 start_codon:yes stop_codon:yes gene_type:complete
MVKLIRLTSEDNANFEANFDSEIKLKEQSQMALHNLTFESNFEALQVNSSNNEVTSQIEKTFNSIMEKTINKQYKASNYEELFSDLQVALNKTLKLSYATPNDSDTYSSYQVRLGRDNKIQILWQATPLMLMFSVNVLVAPNDETSKRTKPFMLISNDINDEETLEIKYTDTNDNLTIANIGNITSTSTDNIATFDKYVTSIDDEDFKFSNGTGIFLAYIHTLVNHAGANNTHGFGMGLSFTRIDSVTAVGGEIPTSARDFEIVVQKTNSAYQFISPTTGNLEPAPGNLTPFKVTPSNAENDTLVFERSGGHIICSVWQTSIAGGVANVIFDYELPEDVGDKPLYPYIYLKGGSDTCVVGRPVITMDSLFDENTNLQWFGNIQTIGGVNADDGGAFRTVFETMDFNNVWDNVTPVIDYQRTQYTDIEQIYKLTMNNEILRFLGWSKFTYAGNKYHTFNITPIDDLGSQDLSWGFVIEADNIFDLINSDSYLVEVLNLPLESYDSSIDVKNSNVKRGKRRNILDVIPINNNTGIVEFSANESLFIDLNNAQPINLTNLHIRVLDKSLAPVETVGTSVITILLK